MTNFKPDSVIGCRNGEDGTPNVLNVRFYNLLPEIQSALLSVEGLKEALEESRAALYGAREITGYIGNIQHAIDLADKALSSYKEEVGR